MGRRVITDEQARRFPAIYARLAAACQEYRTGWPEDRVVRYSKGGPIVDRDPVRLHSGEARLERRTALLEAPARSNGGRIRYEVHRTEEKEDQMSGQKGSGEATLIQEGIRPYVDHDSHRHVYSAECGNCHDVRTRSWGNAAPVDLVEKGFKSLGWRLKAGKSPVCAACLKEDHVALTIVHDRKSLPDLPPATENHKLNRRVYALLDDHFDEEKKLYRPGWDDAAIATSADTSIMNVERIRRGAYGELAENPMVQSLKDDIELTRMELDELSKVFDGRITSMHAKLAELKTQAEKLIIKKFGV
jgi:hypothetical protein